MKKITKLINGSIVVFVICLIAVLTLTGCNNTNSNDNLRKGQNTNITEVQGDEYQVTEKEFKSANQFENCGIVTYKHTCHSLFNGKQDDFSEEGTFNSAEYKDIDFIVKSFDEMFDSFEYDKQSKCYVANNVSISNVKIDKLTLQYKNKKLYEVSWYIKYTGPNGLLNSENNTFIFTYNN